MNTEKVLLSDDLIEIGNTFDKLVEENSKKKQLVLTAHSEGINGTQSDLLKGLGFNKIQNVVSFENRQRELEKIGLTIGTITELQKIKEEYGKNIITYNVLCDLCEKHNLYFGDSELFIGEIPAENIKELEEFPRGLFASHHTVITYSSCDCTSIITGSVSTRCKMIIAAPINQFILKDILITSSREIIKFPNKKYSVKPCPSDDPIVLLPFKVRNVNEVFFLVITHWNISNSII